MHELTMRKISGRNRHAGNNASFENNSGQQSAVTQTRQQQQTTVESCTYKMCKHTGGLGKLTQCLDKLETLQLK